MEVESVRLELVYNDMGLVSSLEEPWGRYTFRICAYDESHVRHEAGKMEVSKLSYGEVERRGMSLGMIFDDFSMETSQCYDVVFTKKGDLRKAFWHQYYGLEEYFARDFHFLNRIEIKEEFKGRGIAGIATQIYFEHFANGNDVAYLKAFPLQHESQFYDKPYSREFSGDFKTDFSKLCKYYERLGFRRIDKTEHFFFVVDDFLSKRAMMGA